jgi:predicted  nucleic acid-binding Zn-ribbon protein
MEQQNVVKRIEGEVAVMTDRLAALQDEVVRLRDSVAETSAQVSKQAPETLAETRAQITAAQRLVSSITRYENELAKMRKDADARDRQQHEVRVRAAKAKAEFDQVKKTYDLAYKKQAAELEKLKARASKASNEIEPDMLERYNTIKRHSMPPMARLNEDRCGGCNMALPAVALHKIRAGSAAVECENCGRILLVK